jgi:hypothetical protein
MPSTSKHLKEEILWDILNESEECVISNSNDDYDDSDNWDDIAVPVAAVGEEYSQVELKGQGQSLGNADYNSGSIWEDMGNIMGNMNYFLVIPDFKRQW